MDIKVGDRVAMAEGWMTGRTGVVVASSWDGLTVRWDAFGEDGEDGYTDLRAADELVRVVR